MTSGGSERHRNLIDGLVPVGPDIGERQPPHVHIPDVAAGMSAADLHLRDGVADDVRRETGIDDDAVGDLARELQRPRSGGGDIDRDAAAEPGELAGTAVVDGLAGLQELADGLDVGGELGVLCRAHADIVDRAVARADADHGASRRKLLDRGGGACGHGRVPGHRIDHARAETDCPGVGGNQSLDHVDVPIERLRVGDPGDGEPGFLGHLDPLQGIHGVVGQEIHAEPDRLVLTAHHQLRSRVKLSASFRGAGKSGFPTCRRAQNP